jgi:hypothetical protein
MPYGNQDGPKMESAKQEKYDLLHDNPVAKDASGGRPWIAKHFKSTMGSSPLKDGHESPMEAGHTSPMETGHTGDSPMEGNAFIKAKIDAEKSGAKSFVVDGKTHPVTMKYGDGPGMHTPNHKNLMEDAGAAAKMHTPLHEYDRLVFGGNKGDKSKSNPGKKDYEK